MGQGIITGGGDKGLYNLKIDFGKSRRDALVATYQARIAVLQSQIPAFEAKRQGIEAKIKAARDDESSATSFYIDAILVKAPDDIIKSARSNLVKARRNVMTAEAAKMAVDTPIETIKADIKGLELQIDGLMSCVIEAAQSAWCVDLTEDGSGAVATLEVPGERGRVLIAPGCQGPVKGEGLLLARQVMTPSQAFFNAAILPGWQMHKPTYRIGVITRLYSDVDKADVTLDPAASSAQGLGINRQLELRRVPIEYMTCNSGAFLVGDRVVVRFDGMSWDHPRVIGFESHPRGCNWPCVYAHQFYYAHYFECLLDDVWSAVYTSTLLVEYRLNRGDWNTINFGFTITFDGTPQAGRPDIYTYQNPAAEGEVITPDPTVEISHFALYPSGGWTDPSVPRIKGIRVDPSPLYPGTEPTILEVRISKAGQVKFNGAFRWNPSNDAPTTTEVLATGGIHIKNGGGIAVSRLTDYKLFVQTGD